jgi:copper(I)-binding protein
MKFRLHLVLLAVALVACSAEQAPLIADDVVITAAMPGVSMGAGYLTLRNTSDVPIRIDSVDSPQLVSVEMHESVLDDGIARMRALPELLIPAGQSVTFEAGGKHLMIRHPQPSPETVTLQFFDNGTLLLEVNVKPEE